ncbi:myb-like protein X [Clytia hemisphaerica]|uniref:Uncharacterized protein n=1 Tax=Clytia hemisphaerica TaxID=252671 RepID=A0A7M5VD54_9CNID
MEKNKERKKGKKKEKTKKIATEKKTKPMESDQQAGEGSPPQVPDKVEDMEPKAEMESGTKQGDGEEMSVETSTPINENPQTGETKENKKEKDSESPPKDTAQNETDVNRNVPEGQGQTVQDSVNPLQGTTVATKNHDEGLEQLESEKITKNDEDVSNVVGQLVENVSQSETDIRVNDEQPQNNETETNAQTNEEARDENLEETIDKNDAKVSEEDPQINESELKVAGGKETKDSETIEPSNHIVNGQNANLDERNTDSSTVEVNKNVDNIEDNEADNVGNESRSNEVDHQTNQVEITQNNASNGDSTKDVVDSNENKTVQSDNKVSNDYNGNGDQHDTDEISAMVKPLKVDSIDDNGANQTSQDTGEANEVKNNENKSQETVNMMSESTSQDVDKEDLMDDILNTDDGLVDPDIDNIEKLDTTKLSEAKDSDLIRIKDDSPNLFDSKEHDRISKSSIADDIDQFLDDEENNDDEAADALTDQLLTQQLPSETKQSPNVEALAYESEYLTRKVQEGRNNEKHLKREIDDKDRKLEDAERKIKDLQIRLIRFARDDEAKDKHVATLEKEMKEINRRLEEVLDEHQERIVAQQQHQQQNGGKITPKQNGGIATQQNNKQRNTQRM